MRGELSSAAHAKRHPYDWYVEEEWVTRQLIEALGNFRKDLLGGLDIWDPACGLGTIPGAFADFGAFSGANHTGRLWLSDIVDRVDAERVAGARHSFFAADFLELEQAPAKCSIVCNPPYSYRKHAGLLISEAFARHALRLTAMRVCLLVPNKWLASQSRWRLFSDHPPQAVLHLTQRPSMPPGDRIAALGSRAHRGGMVDYCWVVWDVTRPTAPGHTRTIWLPPLGRPVPAVEGLA